VQAEFGLGFEDPDADDLPMEELLVFKPELLKDGPNDWYKELLKEWQEYQAKKAKRAAKTIKREKYYLDKRNVNHASIN
jgi:hypothetical protein